MSQINLSVVLATRNEEANLGRCLESVKGIADEIIVVDEESSDKTREVAEKFGAKVFSEPHHEVFHVTKEIALSKASGKWILQLDADEVVSSKLAEQIKMVIDGYYEPEENKLFLRHQKLVEQKEGELGKEEGEVAGYFIPRLNIFLGKPLIHAGVYPDGVIRLVRNGKAHFPQKSVHEQIVVDGRVAWLSGDLLHFDSPTLGRYLTRLNRYTDLQAEELKARKVGKNPLVFINYSLFLPIYTFCNLYFRHLGFFDGARGFLWSFFSAMHFPIAYFKYISK